MHGDAFRQLVGPSKGADETASTAKEKTSEVPRKRGRGRPRVGEEVDAEPIIKGLDSGFDDLKFLQRVAKFRVQALLDSLVGKRFSSFDTSKRVVTSLHAVCDRFRLVLTYLDAEDKRIAVRINCTPSGNSSSTFQLRSRSNDLVASPTPFPVLTVFESEELFP